MPERDPRLVRLISRRYAELQGLTTATQALFIGAVCATWLMTKHVGVMLVTTLALLIPCVRACLALDRFYERRFGRVVPDPARQGWRMWAPIGASTLFLTVVVPDQNQFALLWIVLAAQAGWRVVDGWPYRLHEGVVVVAGIVATVLGGWTPGATDIARGGLLFALAAGISAVGDHYLLSRSLSRVHEPADAGPG